MLSTGPGCRRCLCVAALLSLGVPTSAQANSEVWPQYQGNAGHTGYVNEALRVDAEPKRKWTAPILTAFGELGLAVGDELVYVTPASYFDAWAKLHALSVDDGHEVWSYTPPVTVANLNPPALDDAGNVYMTVTNSGGSYLISHSATGQFRWSTPVYMQWQKMYAPTIANGEIAGAYEQMERHTLDGQFIAAHSSGGYGHWTPVAWGDKWVTYNSAATVYHRSLGYQGYIYHPSYSWNGYDAHKVPVIVNDIAYIAENGGLAGLNLQTFEVAFNRPIQASGQVSTDGTHLYVAAAGMVAVRDLAGNSVRNYADPATSVVGPIIVTRSHVIARTTRNTTMFFDLRKHRKVAELPVGGQMALANGVLYVMGNLGVLETYDVPYVLMADGFE